MRRLTPRFSAGRFSRVLGSVVLLALPVIQCSRAGTGNAQESPAKTPEAERATNDKEAKAPGVGFLWTQNSREVARELTSASDFVDVILGPGKLDVFDEVRPPVRVACLFRSLKKDESRPFPDLGETLALLRKMGIGPERVILAYNPERQPGTPSGEMDDLAGSVARAKELAREWGAPLLVGPGLREMEQHEDLYSELARHCDLWMIQSQRLQLDLATRQPVSPARYREGVRRIVERLREGNPKLRIYVQLVTTAERGRRDLTVDELAAFADAVADLVDGFRLYGGSPELLRGFLSRVRPNS